MTSSNTTSAAKSGPHEAAPAPSANRKPSRTKVDGFSLNGPSSDPDPSTNAYRKDLADVALAGRVIASHYAAPAERHLIAATTLLSAPNVDADRVIDLPQGTAFLMLDDSLGWAWGYAGGDHLVGYVPSELLAR